VRLDGEKHARAQHQKLERTEDYRDPKIHHFLKTLLQQLHLRLAGQATTNDLSAAERYQQVPQIGTGDFSPCLPLTLA
jgi:hypothetical protein